MQKHVPCSSTQKENLAFGELEALAGSGLAGFFALFHSWVTGDETFGAKGNAKIFIGLNDGAAQGQAKGTGLAVDSTTRGFDLDIKSVDCIGDFQRAQDRVLHGKTWEIINEVLAVDFDVSGSWLHADAGDSGFAAAGGDDIFGGGHGKNEIRWFSGFARCEDARCRDKL